jgi:uncharacterized protein
VIRAIAIGDLRRFAVSRSLFPPTTLVRAIGRLGFVQADPIRAPARAQDLTLRHRVTNYRAGDLERRYATLAVEEDVFINYGFLPRPLQALMHPRINAMGWSRKQRTRAEDLLAFVREHGAVHPRDVDRHFAHGTVTNYWGGTSSATTHLLDQMHYGGLLRVVRRDGGIRIYGAQEHPPAPSDPAARRERVDALVDVVVGKYAPMPAGRLSAVISRLRYAVPQWQKELKPALQRAKERLTHARVDGVDWYWPSNEDVRDSDVPAAVRLLGPFDPIVWDRLRFEMFWGWAYRFEAYTPAPKRKLGYYALPLLWRDEVIGWGNLSVKDGRLDAAVGYISPTPPRARAFRRELEAEIERVRVFLGLNR